MAFVTYGDPRYKFLEAQFFFSKMAEQQSASERENSETTTPLAFNFYVSAFLTALLACVERDALCALDQSLEKWCERLRPHESEPLPLLRSFRNREVHRAGAPLDLMTTFDFGPKGVVAAPGQSIFFGQICPGDSAVYYRIDTDGVPGMPIPLMTTSRWVWSTAAGDVDVLETCRHGLQVVKTVLDEWSKCAEALRPLGGIHPRGR